MKDLFESANYPRVLKGEGPSPYKVGAYVFLGQKLEAIGHFENHSWRGDEEAQARFYLVLLRVRSSNYNEMKKELIGLHRTYRALRTRTSKFYLSQSLALIKFYKGEFRAAEESAEQSFKMAFTLEDTFLKMISKDLLAHSTCMQGKIDRGLQYFRESLVYAKMIHNNQNLSVIKLSVMMYKIESGRDLIEEGKALDSWINEIHPKDQSTMTNALILKAKYFFLRGDLYSAREALQNASIEVYSIGQNRQILNYNLLLTLYQLLSLNELEAEGLIGTSLALCQKGQDYFFTQRFQGLKSYISKKAINTDLESKTGISLNAIYPLSFLKDEDVETLFSKNNPLTKNVIDALNKKGLLGILYLTKKIQSFNYINLQLEGRNILLAYKGRLSYVENLSSGHYQLLNLLLTKNRWSKQDIVENYWGVTYDRFIHDNKVYITIKRLKKALGVNGDFIKFYGGELIIENMLAVRKELITQKSNRPFTGHKLNIRQQTLINQLGKEEIVTASQYIKYFGISRHTASRDLKELENKEYLKKEGRGRGTYYALT